MTGSLEDPAIQQALRAVAETTPTAAQAAANAEANMPALREALGGVSMADFAAQFATTPMLGAEARQAPQNRCHRCGAVATTQWQQHATAEAAEAHWVAQEQHIRSLANSLRPEQANYVADRTGPVTKAVHGCDEHVIDAPHLTHGVDCGGHGACACGGEA